MRLSPSMISMLRFIRDVDSYDGCIPRLMQLRLNPTGSSCGKPTRYENLRTHNALLKRALIQEADDDFHTTTLTDEGIKVLSRHRDEH